METTEKIVESYCRYVKQWFTIPNIKCKGQYEVDLLAVDTTAPKRLRRYHVECGVSISGSYSKLTDKPFSPEELKVRVKAAGQRRTIGFSSTESSSCPKLSPSFRSMASRRATTIGSSSRGGRRQRPKPSPRSTGSSCGIFETCSARLPPPAKISGPTSRTIPLGLFSYLRWPPMIDGRSRPDLSCGRSVLPRRIHGRRRNPEAGPPR